LNIAYASLNMSTWLRGDLAGQALIGKKVGVFPDVRLKEEKWYGQSLDKGGLDWPPSPTSQPRVPFDKRYRRI
jgi:hypothetical protein